MPAKKKPATAQPPDAAPAAPTAAALDDTIDFRPIILEVVQDFAQPISPIEVETLTTIPLARVTEILDELVTAGDLILGDDQLYRQAIDGAGIIAETDEYVDVFIPHVSPDSEPSDAATGERTVSLPTSDLYAFLSHINLPPEQIAGFGTLSAIAGELTYGVADGDDNDFRVEIRGRHRVVRPRLNPNQPGYRDDSGTLHDLGGVFS